MSMIKTLTINGVTYKVSPIVPTVGVTLKASAWEGSDNAYSQVVTVPGVTRYTKVDLQPTPEQLEEFHYKTLAFVTENVNGIVTVYSIGDKPEGDHTIPVTLTAVECGGKIRGNTVGTPAPQPDWNQTDPTKADYIKNKPTHYAEQPGSSSGAIVSLTNAADTPLHSLRIFGKTTQNGTPSPDAPVPLESLAAGGSVGVAVTGKNLYSRGDSKTVNAYATMELPVPLPPGTYTISALVSSTDTDNSTSFANFMHHNGSSYVVAGSAKLQRDVYNSATVTIATTCEAIRFHAGTNIGNSEGDTATWSDIMVEAGAAATVFEPYKGQTFTVSTPNGLPGIPVSSGGNYTDETGQQWVCDEIDFARGVYIHRVGGGKLAEVTNWRGVTNIDTHVRIFGTAHSDWYKNTRSYSYNKSKGLYSHGKYAERYDEDTAHAYMAGSYVYVFVPPEIASTVEELTAWITAQENAGTPPEIMVALDAECVVETALSAEELAAYAAMHTCSTTTVWNSAGAHMELRYYTPAGAMPVVRPLSEVGKILTVDEHGCVVASEAYLYGSEIWSKPRLRIAVGSGVISEAEYEEITGEAYV